MYIFATFSLTYGGAQAAISKSSILDAIVTAAVIELATIPLFGALSDRFGRCPAYMFGAALLMVWPIAFFAFFDTRLDPLVWFGIIIGISVGHAATWAPQASIFAELFDARVRCSGMSITFNLSSILAGVTPLVAAWLLALAGGHWWPIAVYLGVIGAISVTCTYLLRETTRSSVALRPAEPLPALDQAAPRTS
ncbi:MFS transporter [Pseudonocardia xishanensis]|uniref:Major facilitator superfamily (MFS) profile domain-containing protein n=1 Tax=Pseudonocardia xishanensis TaxID=630995 RepID=A0ABP8REJ7_9PSEU